MLKYQDRPEPEECVGCERKGPLCWYKCALGEDEAGEAVESDQGVVEEGEEG